MFLVINKGLKTLDSVLNLKEMQRLVGIEGEEAYIEAVYNQFFDPTITLICDDEFKFKGLSPTCLTKQGITLHGQVLVVKNTGENFTGLTQKQEAIVKKELIIL